MQTIGAIQDFPYLAPQAKYCEGFFAGQTQAHYVLGVNFSVAKVAKQFSHDGSSNLDDINAFDLAEVSAANIGQINMMKVSSFCGPKGLIWGYDLCKSKTNSNEWGITSDDICADGGVRIYSIESLADSFKRLTGTPDSPRFPFLPGSHVPCATKSINREGPCILYSGLAIGIPYIRETQACVLMEDFGTIPLFEKNIDAYEREICINICKSVLQIGKNQRVQYKEIFIGIRRIKVEAGEVGCALVAAPYFVLPTQAVPSPQVLLTVTLDEWEKMVCQDFLSASLFSI
jgi:histidine decarboxylase